MKVSCRNCGAGNEIPDSQQPTQYRCWRCHTQLPAKSTHSAEGAVVGATLGALVGGPPGALIGALIGALLGEQTKS